MKKRPFFATVCALVLSTLTVHASEGGPTSDLGARILERLITILEGVAAVVPEFMQGFFLSLISFLQVLLGG